MSYPLSGRSLYRIKAADLSNEKLSSEELSKRVERTRQPEQRQPINRIRR